MSDENSKVVSVHSAEHGTGTEAARVTTAASWEWLVNGYRRALARFAETAHERDPQARFIPLFETLNWTVAIMDYSQDRGPQIGNGMVRALRFVRNQVHHQWADALEARDVPFPQVSTATGPDSRIIAPPTALEWFWTALDRLPPGRRDANGESAYAAHLEGKRVHDALAHLDSLLDT